MHKPTASFSKSTKIGQKQGIQSSETLYSLKCVITDIYDVYLFLLITNTFNGSFEPIVMEMTLTETFCSYYVNKI